MTVRWRHCVEADEEHRENQRQYAHTYHYGETICLAKSFWELPRQYRDGIILHEVGHLLAGPEGSEADANRAVEEWSGAKIQYVDSPYGRRLERVTNMAGARIIRRRNPMGNELPYGEWVPTHAVKFNHDGTVDVMTEGPTHNRGLPNIAAGFIDTEGDFGPPGHFHPIRASYDYSRKRGGDKEKKRAKPKKRAKAKRRS